MFQIKLINSRGKTEHIVEMTTLDDLHEAIETFAPGLERLHKAGKQAKIEIVWIDLND